MGRRWASEFVELATCVSRVVVGVSCERSVYMNLAFACREVGWSSRTRSVSVSVCVTGGGTLEVRPLYLLPRATLLPALLQHAGHRRSLFLTT